MSSILLKRIWNGDLTGASIVLFWFIIGMSSLLLTKGCRSNGIEAVGVLAKDTTADGYWTDSSTWVKMGSTEVLTYSKPYFVDTSKPKPINHRLILSGSDTTFRFLVFAIQNPLDVTPNQKTQLLQWINNSLKQDTTKQK